MLVLNYKQEMLAHNMINSELLWTLAAPQGHISRVSRLELDDIFAINNPYCEFAVIGPEAMAKLCPAQVLPGALYLGRFVLYSLPDSALCQGSGKLPWLL